LRSVTPLRGKSVTALQFDSLGFLWAGTDSGLYVINRYNGAVVNEIPGLPSGHVLDISTNTGNKAWIGTDEGLAWVSLNSGRARPHRGLSRP
jgi:ligand-binding sensor domain-containing protein